MTEEKIYETDDDFRYGLVNSTLWTGNPLINNFKEYTLVKVNNKTLANEMIYSFRV